MDNKEVIRLKEVLDILDDLTNAVHYYCIAIYGVRDSFVDESLARARKVSAKARKELLEADNENS